ncbi:hypothetical protein FACS1894217_01390 [Clostridia bacterium]|nr:hypothetical protein FACS1894217_01390 [Clostridia bacterium]
MDSEAKLRTIMAKAGQSLLDSLALLGIALNIAEDENRGTKAGEALAYVRKAYTELCLTARSQTALADADVTNFDPEVYDVVSYCRAVVGQANSLAGSHKFKLRSPHAMLPCVLPEQYLRRALLTLLSMGAESAEEEQETVITLGTAEDNITASVEVQADPEPIPDPETLDRTDEGIHLLKEWTRRTMVSRILAPYGGSFEVKGGRATITFPRGYSDELTLRSPEVPDDSDDRVWLSPVLTVKDYKVPRRQ